MVTSSDGNRRHGMTVTSFASLALEPPLILVSLENTTRTNSMVHQSGKFAVAILSEEQQDLSDLFAGRLPDDDNRFEEIPYFETELGCPIPEGSLAYMDCQVESNHPAGTHTIFIGKVETGVVLQAGPPLLYHNQNYTSLQHL